VGDLKLMLQKNNAEEAGLYDNHQIRAKAAELQTALAVYAKADKDAVAND
jgi:hypothetical protein